MTESHAELEVAQRYAANLLAPSEAAAFEEHLLTCERCQSEALLGVGLRRISRETPSLAHRRRATWIASGAVLLAAAIAAVMILPTGRARELAQLGRVTEAPPYVALRVRSSMQAKDSLFAAAMSAYSAGRYEEAAVGLQAALADGADSIRASFFLGSSQLMIGRPRDAADAFARVIAGGQAAAPYLSEVHLLRARALLQLGRVDDALAELNAVDRSDLERRAIADTLTARVNEVVRR